MVVEGPRTTSEAVDGTKTSEARWGLSEKTASGMSPLIFIKTFSRRVNGGTRRGVALSRVGVRHLEQPLLGEECNRTMLGGD